MARGEWGAEDAGEALPSQRASCCELFWEECWLTADRAADACAFSSCASAGGAEAAGAMNAPGARGGG